MADRVACLVGGKIVIVQDGTAPVELVSPYAQRLGAGSQAMVRKQTRRTMGAGAGFQGGGHWAPGADGGRPDLPRAHVVGITRGRVSGELCYAISASGASGVFAQKLGISEEHRLFHNADVQIRELDFSFADEAFTCTVEGKSGTSAIGVLADDGKGVRTVTEGDVLDRAPRWVPGIIGEIVYASAGVGRTRAGAWAGRSPFSLHRLRMADSTVEVLVSDAKYDYLAPVAVSGSLLYAIRRAYEEPEPTPVLRAITQLLVAPFGLQKASDAERIMVWGNWLDVSRETAAFKSDEDGAAHAYKLVRISPKGSEEIAQGVIAFDVAPNGDIVYSTGRMVYRVAPARGAKEQLLAELPLVEQIVIC